MTRWLQPVAAVLLMASFAAPAELSAATDPLAPRLAQTAEDPEPPAPGPDNARPQGGLHVTLAEAILMALEHNRSLAVQRTAPAIAQRFEEEARAAFDPVLSAGAVTQRSEGREATFPGLAGDLRIRKHHQGSVALDTFFPTGTELSVEARADHTDAGFQDRSVASTRLGVGVSQALLRGFGREVNLAVLRQARLETRISLYELQAYTDALVAQVESAYWNYALSLRQIEIVEESLNLAEQQLADTRSMIQVGALAEAELPALQAEVALQRQGWIDVKKAVAASRLRLLRLLNPPHERLWDVEITLVHPPAIPEVALDSVEDHVASALLRRPEIHQTRLEIDQGELEVVRTKNGLLPRLDLFITLGKSGYADSFGGSFSDLGGPGYDVLAGFHMEFPPINRGAKARHGRAMLGRQQAEKALSNLTQLVEWDIRNAYLEVDRSRQQITAGRATRQWQEEKVRIETEKFRVGRSTNMLVAQAQRDLLVSRIEEVRSVVDYLQALTDFYRLEGSLLERRGIHLPFDAPRP